MTKKQTKENKKTKLLGWLVLIGVYLAICGLGYSLLMLPSCHRQNAVAYTISAIVFAIILAISLESFMQTYRY